MKSTLYIQNLKCSGCESTIINKLSAIKGISNIVIKLQYDTITFEHESKEIAKIVKNILSKIGYPPFGIENSLGQKAKSYLSCASGKIKN